MMSGHDEMRQFGLGLAVPRERRIFAGNTVRSERAEEIELRRAGVFGPMIGQIDDFTCAGPSIALWGSSTKLRRFSECQ